MAPITTTADGGVAVIIVNYRTPELTIDCLASIAAERQAVPGLHVMIVDGGSDDGSAETIARAIEARGHGDWASLLALDVNGGFGFANNQGIFALRDRGMLPPFVCLINPDARVRPGALRAMLDLLAREPRAGAAGARLELDDGRNQGSAFVFPSLAGEFCRGARTDLLRRLLRQPHVAIESDTARRVPWVTGAAVTFRRAALEQAGLFDDGFFLYYEETELMARLTRLGWEIWHEPAARVVHLGGKATNLRDVETGRMLPGRLPRYWYDSRRRYFVRVGGRLHAIAAGLSYLAGRLIWQARCVVQRRVDNDPRRSTRDFIAFSLWPRPEDVRPAQAPGLRSEPPALPAWMREPA